jgi:hypothetical protein
MMGIQGGSKGGKEGTAVSRGISRICMGCSQKEEIVWRLLYCCSGKDLQKSYSHVS